MKNTQLLWRLVLLVATVVGSPVRPTRGDTNVTVTLVRADAAGQSVASAKRGSVVPYSHYRGPVTTWAFGLGVDGKQFFDQRDAQGRVVERRTRLELTLADGEHVIEPVGLKFRLTGGKIESLSPEIRVEENRLALRLFAVKFATPDADGPPAPVRVRIAAPGGELFRSQPATYALPLVVYLPAAPPDGYSTNLSDRRLLVSEQGASWAAPTASGQPRRPPK